MSFSTHVLDAVAGGPAAGVAVRLDSLDEGLTDGDGRWSSGLELAAGVHRMRFETGAWFAAQGRPTFYPVVEITFEVTSPAAHHHVPLLLSPFAYSTYRGS